MLPDRAGSPAFFRKLMISWLCMLAFVFALEAKTAWYGPVTDPGSAVQFAKALPADLPQVVSHGIPTPDPVHPALPFLFCAAFVCLAGSEFGKKLTVIDSAPSQASASWFSPQSFFRPPPTC